MGVSFVRYYNKLRFFARLGLFFAVLFVMLVAVEAALQKNIYVLFLCCVSVFVFVIPYYFVAYIIEKQKKHTERYLRKTFDCIEYMAKQKDEEFQNDFEKEIADKKDMTYLLEYVEKSRNLFSDIKKKDRLLNEILISTVVNRDIEKFLSDVMPKIMSITKSQFIVFYIANKITNKLEIKSSIGFGKSIYSQFDINMGEGFLGRAAVDNRIIVINELDDDSIYVTRTFLGNVKPKSIIAVPVNDVDDENDILGVFAIGSVYKYTDRHIEIMEEIRKYTAYAVVNGVFYNKSVRLTNELKFQNQLIQNLNEDLEMKIKERTGMLNNILNSIKDYAVIFLDVNRNIVMINDGVVQNFNISRENVVGKNISEISQFGFYIYDKSKDYIDEALKKGKSNHIYNYESKKGHEKIVEVEIFSVKNEYGDVSGVTVVIKDMSYVKKLRISQILEKKMTDIMLEESSNSIIVVRDDYTIEGISKDAVYLIGMDKNKVYGMFIWEVFSNEKEVRKFIKEAFENSDLKIFNASAANTKINITMRVKLLTDDTQGAKKMLIYL